MIRVQGYVQDYDTVHLNGDYSMWHVLLLTWISNHFQDSKIRFNFKSNLTSAISDFSKSRHLASYISCHNAMAYDRAGAGRVLSPTESTSMTNGTGNGTGGRTGVAGETTADGTTGGTTTADKDGQKDIVKSKAKEPNRSS
jgi:hypothetical protein